ncbi:BamA/TamA family outer membrane protein [Longibacter salinarum]|uniref:BamA/TamA family outer membrane protein n=1 Tax=Longibacter salinarum TaxID=1850348 RepID=UPI0015CF0F32|nr:BamA/TamA family outer membrane protein [Longibacter salinarum]
MERRRRIPRLGWALVVAFILITVPVSDVAAHDEPGARAGPSPTVSYAFVDADTSDVDPHPNAVPYRTNRSIWVHLLSAPSYALYGVTRPLGWGVKYLEREFPTLFEPRLPVRGALPIVELGGPVGIQGGVALFDQNLWGVGHDARVSALYGSRSRYEVQLDYGLGSALGSRTDLSFSADFFTHPERRYFLRGNRADKKDETRYFTRQFASRITLGLQPINKLSGDIQFAYTRSQNKAADGELGARLPTTLPGLDRITNLLSARTSWSVDFTGRTEARTVRGTRFTVEGELTNDLNGSTFRYVRYAAEVQQYVPLVVLPPTRRLALRLRLDKVEPVRGGAAVPFFRLPGIGGQSTVRSLVFDRFVEEGAIVANAEYHYPIWNRMDAVVFVDAGQVFNEFEMIALDRFHVGYGAGVRVLRGGDLAFRLDVATGEEGVRAILTVNKTF